LTFAPMKMAFLFPENAPFFGRVELLNIGLSQQFIEATNVNNYLIENYEIQQHLQHRSPFGHKGNFGHGLLISGSYGKFGAAVLCAGGCLRSGIGLLTVHTPASGMTVLQTSQPEAMVSLDKNNAFVAELPDISRYNAIGIGPGIGTEKETQNVVKLLIQNYPHPIVFDADAINILAEQKTWLQFLPKGCIFTPHPKEFERLVGKADNDYERNKLQREFSQKFCCYVVLKGHRTAITTPDGSCYFNSTGNVGMATGGCGDVLTGIITGLLAQGYHPKLAAVLGVYIHGLAGDIASEELGFNALLAGDVVKNIGKAFLKINDMCF
ncbi:MAG: NAD(P)H-hydrate dehydratase, partial [Bacteroidales bacterium]|nr:NAD(P)H-hydrate dehydratase [Bacteroidales bacterium]